MEIKVQFPDFRKDCAFLSSLILFMRYEFCSEKLQGDFIFFISDQSGIGKSDEKERRII